MAPLSDLKKAQEQNWVGDMGLDASRAGLPNTSRVRVEIDEFLEDNVMTNLFLLALIEMHKEGGTKGKDTIDWWTFYNLGAIHGWPGEKWDGIDKPGYGYCSHGKLVFPTWHRVYMKAFEQAVANKMQELVDKFKDEREKAINQIAASRFRLPFWDPLLPRHRAITTEKTKINKQMVWGIPKILAQQDVWVKYPDKKDLSKVNNPLYQFNFPDQQLLEGRESIKWENLTKPIGNLPPDGATFTIRSPGRDGKTNIYGIDSSDKTGLELRLQMQAESISSKLWKLLARYTIGEEGKEYDQRLRSWKSFATHNWVNPEPGKWQIDPQEPRGSIKEGDTAISLESWHDDIHILIGTGPKFRGHMGDTKVAGFDPIFWLHHCNIDRILAIYQALYPDNHENPDRWLDAEQADAKLFPFRKDNEEFWTSNDVKDWKSLGFAVPGDKDLGEDGKKLVEVYLHNYYNWAASGDLGAPPKDWPRDLSYSIALNGYEAEKTDRETVTLTALDNRGLVTRVISLPVEDDINVLVKDTPKLVNTPSMDFTASKAPTETINDGSTLTWTARVRVKKFAFRGSFNIHLFIGHIKNDQTERYLTKKNEVGFSGVFANASPDTCVSCAEQQDAGVIYEDAIPITPALSDYLKSNTLPADQGPEMRLRVLEDYSPEQVVPFLKTNLDWRLTDLASQLFDNEQLIGSGLEIMVSARKFDLPTEEFPMGVYHPATAYREITESKVGGYGFVAST